MIGVLDAGSCHLEPGAVGGFDVFGVSEGVLPLEHAADHLNVPAFFQRGFAIGEDGIDNTKLAALKEGTLAGKRGLTDLGRGFSFSPLFDSLRFSSIVHLFRKDNK